MLRKELWRCALTFEREWKGSGLALSEEALCGVLDGRQHGRSAGTWREENRRRRRRARHAAPVAKRRNRGVWGIVLRPGAHTAPWWDNDRNLPGPGRTRTRSLNYKGQPLAAYESNVFRKNHSSLEHPVDPVASMRNTVHQKVPGLWVSSAPTEIPPRRILT